jgi:hypothetical protein
MYNSNTPNNEDLPTSQQLIRSTIIAILVACVLLVFVVLPSEYGIDTTGFGRVLGLTQMGEIKTSLAKEAKQEELKKLNKKQTIANTKTGSKVTSKTTTMTAKKASESSRSNERRLTLQPGEAAEIKLEMKKGAVIQYEWIATGGKLNHDTHGDPYKSDGSFHSYKKGQMISGDKGQLKAIYGGHHGWYWRNRDKKAVTIILKTKGNYLGIKRLM